MNPPPESSSPPVDARVACVDGGASPTTNKACPEPTSKLDDHGRGGLLVEAGKTYINRDGFRVAIRSNGGTILYPWRGETLDGPYAGDVDGYTGEGLFEISKESGFDLIAPWIDWKAECEAWKAVALPLAEAFNVTGHHRPDCICACCCNAKEALSKMECLIDREVEQSASLKGEGAGA